MGKSSDRGRTWRVMVKVRHPVSISVPSDASPPLSLFNDDRLVHVICESHRGERDASDPTVEVFTRWSCRVDRCGGVLPLPTFQKSAFLCHDRLFVWRRHTDVASTDEMEPSLSHYERGNFQKHPPFNTLHPASPHSESLLRPTNLVHLHQGR